MRVRASQLLLPSIIIAAILGASTLTIDIVYNNSRISNFNAVTAIHSNAVVVTQNIEKNVTYNHWIHESPAVLHFIQHKLLHYFSLLTNSQLKVFQYGVVNLIGKKWTTSVGYSSSSGTTKLSLIKSSAIMTPPFPVPLKHIDYTYDPFVRYIVPMIIARHDIGYFFVSFYKPSSVQFVLPRYFNSVFIGSLLLILILMLLIKRPRNFSSSQNALKSEFIKAVTADPFSEIQTLNDFNDSTMEFIVDLRSRLHFQESFLDSIFCNSTLGIIQLSATGSIFSMNQASVNLTGINLTEFINLSIYRLVHKLRLDPNKINDIKESVINGNNVYNFKIEYRNIVSNEQCFVLCTVVESSINKATVIGYTILIEDITDRNLWDSYYTKSDRLYLVAELAASTAHEIRNPLTTVRGFLQLQRKRDTSDNHKSHYQIMIDEIDRVDLLISEYLMLARDLPVHQVESVSLSNMLLQLIPLITAEANMKGIQVNIIDVAEGHCAGNKNELKQVLLNLCKNAIDAMSPGGILTIAGSLDYNVYTISIRDTGTGIDEKQLNYIFKPFFTTKITGSGIGLSVSKRIIDAHRGTIEIDTKLGSGTTFYVKLPTTQEESTTDNSLNASIEFGRTSLT